MISNADEFARLCECNDRRVKHDEVSEEILLDVLERYPEWVICAIGSNYVTVGILESLAKSPDAVVRWWVATKRKLSVHLFELLSNDEDPSVRHRIAYNRKTPRYILERLANDEDNLVAKTAQERLEHR